AARRLPGGVRTVPRRRRARARRLPALQRRFARAGVLAGVAAPRRRRRDCGLLSVSRGRALQQALLRVCQRTAVRVKTWIETSVSTAANTPTTERLSPA